MRERHSSTLGQLGWWFTLALRTWPEHQRLLFAEEILSVLEARSLAHRGLARFSFALREGSSLIRAGMALRFSQPGAAGVSVSATLAATTVTDTRARTRPKRDWPMIERTRVMRSDLRLALRQLLRSPSYTVVAVVLLAHGLGATTAAWTTVDTILLAPLPYQEPDRLVQLWESNLSKGWRNQSAAPANVLDWRERVSAFEDVAAWSAFQGDGLTFRLDPADEPERLSYARITGNLFSVLQVEPALGRFPTWEETWRGTEPVVVISAQLHERRFGGDPGVIGQVLEAGGLTATIIGVAPAGFRLHPGTGDSAVAGVGAPDLWIPYRWADENRDQPWFRRAHFVNPVARLAPGVSQEAAAEELASVARILEQEYPELNREMGAGLTPLKPWVVRSSRAPLWVIFGTVLALLLVAFANVISVSLVRSNERSEEWALRRALGASGRTLARLLWLEGLLVAVPAALLGGGLAAGALRALRAWAPADLPRIDELQFDGRSFLLLAALALLAPLVCSVLPSFGVVRLGSSSRPDWRPGALRSGVDAGTRRKTSFLVAAEIAVAVVLVTVVGVLGRSLLQLYAVDPGFEPAGVLTATVELPNDRYDAAARDNTFSELIERSRGLPGVTSAGMISALPLHGQTWTFDVTVEGAGEAGYISEARHMTIDSGYFETARVPLLAGRWFTEADGTAKGETRDDPGVVIVNRLAVERHFGGRDPIGQTIHTGAPDSPGKHAIVIGVVENEAQDALSAPLLPQIYEPYKADARTQMTVVMRTDGEPSSLAGPFRGVLRDIDSTLPILDLQTQLEVVDSSLLLERFLVSTTGALASLALLFAALGVYATLAFWVSRRRHEIGVRQALGASSGDLLGLVLARGLKPVVVGAGVGLGASLLLGFVTRRFVGELLYQTTPWDPATLVSALAVLALVSLVACLGPALRAVRSDPNETLRAQ